MRVGGRIRVTFPRIARRPNWARARIPRMYPPTCPPSLAHSSSWKKLACNLHLPDSKPAPPAAAAHPEGGGNTARRCTWKRRTSMNEIHQFPGSHDGARPHRRARGQRASLPGYAGPVGGQNPPCWASRVAGAHCSGLMRPSVACILTFQDRLRPAQTGPAQAAPVGRSLPAALHGSAGAAFAAHHVFAHG
jgi:hypothetical protein